MNEDRANHGGTMNGLDDEPDDDRYERQARRYG